MVIQSERLESFLAGTHPTSDAPLDTERLTSRFNPLRVANLANHWHLSNK